MSEFNPFSFDLPVAEIIPEVKNQLSQSNSLIIQAPPGAGKSTLLPLTFLDEPWLEGKKILMLEPRRLATKSIAQRMASMLGEDLGDTIGYRIRFESSISAKTKIEVITEGILTRMMHSDNALENVGLVIFDEFHERNLHSEVALALCREIQQVLRPDLRILLMSATIDAEQLSRLLGAKVIQSQGRQFPVEVNYLSEIDEFAIGEDAARQIIPLTKKHEGDFLVFLPGQGEIKKTEQILKKALPDTVVVPLFGQLSPSEQNRAMLPHPSGKRKIVLSTDIAETSLTIEGIKVVVDSGFAKSNRFDARSGLSRLVLHRISKDSADQRSGRAGRLTAGHSYRLWSKATQGQLPEYRVPELMEADLTALVLDMKAWGKQEIRSMTWLTPPPAGTLALAEKTLEAIDAIAEGNLTEHGKEIHQVPCHPRIAHMLLFAKRMDQLGLATDIAAVLEERDPLPQDSGVDLNLRIEALRRFRSRGVNLARIKKIEKVASQYRRMFGIQPENEPVDPWQTGLLLAYAYPERIAAARPGNNAQFQLSNGKIAQIGHRDDLAHEPWLAVAHVDAREGMGKIWLAAPLNPKDLAPLLKTREVLEWDRKKGGLIALSEVRIGSIVLGTRPLQKFDKVSAKTAILEAIAEDGEMLLDFNQKVEQLIFRVQSLNKWNSDQNWPFWTSESLCLNAKDWLEPYLDHVTKNEELKKLDLFSILLHTLSFEQQQVLDDLAPSHLTVPSGSQIPIEYKSEGETPLLSVRLQELFGLLETPKVNDGKVPVLIELLSPGYKSVQLTQDLKSFWANGYFEVKKELKRRYPKHEWPEDPISAEAVRGVKKRV
ncbi:ATP-dependent helicase HrpB [Algoriphagus boritolerans]|uniref:ATP-dependent helicase HrpB n=2 Tax=Algoriphagus TaxID=246875 RepID=A0A1H5XLB1_9BACT|nr:ATP-dependent helicase HrpB [Algoriphagus boritolerans]SEG12579.1 ATP-dependent helicase HrpB [Algoriphagus boritolerans DSM 17298 = JCM 18970]